jgi:hypothetical protein
MAFYHNVNVSITGANDLQRSRLHLFTLKTLLKARGWTVQGTGTGNTGAFDNVGVDLWVTAASIVGEGAWVRLRHTLTGIELIMSMRNTSGAEEFLGCLWSRAAQFTGGSPSATAPPTATDQVTVADRTLGHCNIPTANFVAQYLCDSSSPAFLAYAGTGVNALAFICLFDWLEDVKSGDAKPGFGAWTSGVPLQLLTLQTAAIAVGYNVDDVTVQVRGTSGLTLIQYFDINTGQDAFELMDTSDARTGNAPSVEVLWFGAVNTTVRGTSRILRQVSYSHDLHDVSNDKLRYVIGSTDAMYSVPGNGVTTPTN